MTDAAVFLGCVSGIGAQLACAYTWKMSDCILRKKDQQSVHVVSSDPAETLISLLCGTQTIRGNIDSKLLTKQLDNSIQSSHTSSLLDIHPSTFLKERIKKE